MNDYVIQHGVAAQLEAPSSCGCCEGTAIRTPQSIFNRPGLSQLSYRIGTHATFLESLLAQIASYGVKEQSAQKLLTSTPAESSVALALRSTTTSGLAQRGGPIDMPPRLLNELLTTRERSDFAIALFEAWASLADVLTFYQERLANEGFVRTAQDQRSLYELSRLTGYRPRPGVSASVYLAFEVEDTANQNNPTSGGFGPTSPADFTATTTALNLPAPPSSAEILIPVGTAAKSTPTPGSTQQPQTFETTDDLVARPILNVIRLRQTRPQEIIAATVFDLEELHFKKTGLRLQSNDYLAVQYDPAQPFKLHRIQEVIENQEKQITTAMLFQDELSPRKLLNELVRINEDLANLPLDNLFDKPPEEFKDAQNAVQQALADVSRPSDGRLRLIEIDSRFEELILGDICDYVERPPARPKGFWAAANSAARKLEALLKSRCKVFEKLATNDFRKFQVDVEQLIDQIKLEDQQLTELVKLLPDNSTLALRSQFLKQTGFDIVSSVRGAGSSQAPVTTIFTSGEPNIADATKPFDGLQVASSDINNTPADWKATITQLAGTPANLPNPADPKFVLSSEVEAKRELAATSGMCTLTDLINQLRQLNTSQDDRAFLIELRATGANAFGLLQSATFTVQSAHHISYPTEKSVEQAVTFQVPVPLPSLDKKYAFRITLKQLLPDSGQGSTGGSVEFDATHYLKVSADNEPYRIRLKDGEQLSSSELLKIAGTIKYKSDSSASIVAAVVEVFVDDVPNPFVPKQCVACSLVHFVPGDRELARALADRFNIFATPGTDYGTARAELLENLWPKHEDDSAALYKTGGLEDKLFAATSLAEAIGIVQKYDEPKGNEPWALRLQQFKWEALNEYRDWPDQLHDCFQEIDTQLDADSGEIAGAIDKRFKTLIGLLKGLRERLQTAANKSTSSNEDVLKVVNDAIEDIKNTSTMLTTTADWVVSKLGDAIAKVARSLLKRRKRFALEIVRRLALYGGPLLNSAPDTPELAIVNAVKDALKKLQDEFSTWVTLNPEDPSTPTAMSAQELDRDVDKLSDEEAIERVSQQGPTCNTLTCLSTSLARLIGNNKKSQIKSNEETLTNWAPKLLQDRKTAVESLISSLSEARARIGPRTEGAQDAFTNPRAIAEAADRLNRLQAASGPAQVVLLSEFLKAIDSQSDLAAKLLSAVDDNQRRFLFSILRTARIGEPTIEPKVFAFRSRAKLFGWNVPAKNEGLLQTKLESIDELFLDGSYDHTATDSIIAIGNGKFTDLEVFRILKSETSPHSEYELSNTCTHLRLDKPWWSKTAKPGGQEATTDFREAIRSTSVLCDAEQLELSEEPIDSQLDETQAVECDQVIEGLSIGRQVIFEGEPIVVGTRSNAQRRELFTVTDVNHVINQNRWGDTFHTKIRFDRSTSLPYRRESVRMYANVVQATHGETHKEVLGSGDAGRAFQAFGLQRAAVTQLPAPTPRGTDDQLSIYINDAAWHEKDSFVGLNPDDRKFVALVGSEQQAEVIFGDGEKGARLPTGVENIQATYRTGVGHDGNVAARQIDQLVGAPLGVKKVVNPLPAQGGADPDSVDLIRTRAPLEVSAMDRLVSIKDYADFARNYAGIGKASATRLQGMVHVTVAGLKSEPFDMDGPLIRNLQHAMEIFGDPSQQFRLADREAKLLIIVANIGIEPDRQWQKIEPIIRGALLARFRYEDADLGQDVLLADAISTIHSVDGVTYVDIDRFDAVDQRNITDLVSRLNQLRRLPRIHVSRERLEDVYVSTQDQTQSALTKAVGGQADRNARPTNGQAPSPATRGFRSAQVCYLSPDIPGTLILEQAR